ncbi:MAG TPA: ATP-binding protein [Nocardioides sp.]|uniref:sensor histidine kinase n=1 Tax=Nocardioides sp. TaxID=35761 RepID=UPI002CBAE619|nr:ATP-binding protein [Nocardioides sp.]HQR27484.1 ATP-binding protein [Nocardioides sp.]
MAEPQPSGLQFFADAFPDGIVGADLSGTVTVLNETASRMLQVPVPDAVGAPLTDVLRLQDSHGRTWVEMNRPLDSINIRTAVPEQSWLLPSGDEVLVTARIVRRGRLGPVAGVGIGLRSGRGRARLDRDRSDLVATVAHELRSPLTGVKGFVQALVNRWDKLNDEQKKLMLTTVNADADRLSRLIAELLDVARIDTGRLSLYPRPVDAVVLVQRVVDSVQAGTARTIDFTPPAELPEPNADPDKFTQVVTNLVENAVRHGEGTVTVTLAPLGPGHDVEGICLTVDDEGEGIATEIRRRVFTKFWTGGVRGGSGLGMYIVNGLTRAHGGTVTIDDAPGGGARVRIEWPSADPED